MSYIVELIEQYGLLVVFFNVLIEQLGAPLPAYPTMLVAGALADFAWYSAGRRYGNRVMATLCRISLSPDSCVKQTESIYLRFGPASLLVAKFIPGFASVASALAGAIGTRRSGPARPSCWARSSAAPSPTCCACWKRWGNGACC